MGISECRPRAGSGVRRVLWLVPHQAARLALRADGGGEAGDACGGECAQEFIKRPGWVGVGGVLVELCPAMHTLRAWAEANVGQVLEARRRYDSVHAASDG